MNTKSWKLSALVSALLLGGTLTASASDSERDSERFSSYTKYYEDEKDEDKKEKDEDEEDEKDEDEEDERDEDEKDEDEEDEKDEDESNTDIVLPTTYTENAGRLLGSQCAQCHGTNGVSTNSWDSIAGEDNLEDEIYEDDEPIMSAQAHGYTSEEIILIGDWLKTLKNND